MMGYPMANKKGWVRVHDSVADILRRGAWYPILEDTGDGHLVVDCYKRRVRLSTADVQVRADPPDNWSVVIRTGVLRPTLGGQTAVTTTYAVCPSCQERQEFTGKPSTLRCVRCGRESTVDWTQVC